MDRTKEEIEKIKRLEMEDIRIELEEIRNRWRQIINCHFVDNSESLHFKEYKRNPMAFMDDWKKYYKNTG